jgi:hypothetical protein
MCSFCGMASVDELIRAGGEDHWICFKCVAEPVVIVEGALFTKAPCTFCGCVAGFDNMSERHIVVARRGAFLCDECLEVAIHYMGEAKARRVRS